MSKEKSKKGEKKISVEKKKQIEQKYILQPEEGDVKMHAKNWPLLLKNYDKMNILSTHYTPIPAGSTPLNRPFK